MKIFDSKEITQPFKIFPLICSIYTAIVITLISLAGRLSYIPIPHLGKIYISVDFFLVPILFFIQNIITEVYGYTRAKQVNQISILGLLIFYLYQHAAVLMPTPNGLQNQMAFNQVASTYSRHFVAFLFALYFGAIVNQYLISKIKILCNGKWLWFRAIFSTFLGDFVYQVIGSVISRYNVLSITEIFSYDILSYLYKLAFETATVPFIYAICAYLKNIENIDIYDKDTNFNPFSIEL